MSCEVKECCQRHTSHVSGSLLSTRGVPQGSNTAVTFLQPKPSQHGHRQQSGARPKHTGATDSPSMLRSVVFGCAGGFPRCCSINRPLPRRG